MLYQKLTRWHLALWLSQDGTRTADASSVAQVFLDHNTLGEIVPREVMKLGGLAATSMR